MTLPDGLCSSHYIFENIDPLTLVTTGYMLHKEQQIMHPQIDTYVSNKKNLGSKRALMRSTCHED